MAIPLDPLSNDSTIMDVPILISLRQHGCAFAFMPVHRVTRVPVTRMNRDNLDVMRHCTDATL